MVEKTNGKRIVWLDVARCFAIISISSNHAINRAFRSVGSSYDAYVSLPHIDSVFRAIIFVFSRLGAPIFLMISGSLLLEKKMDNSEDVRKFYKHNLFSILITSEIWYFLMFWYRTLLGSNDILKSGGGIACNKKVHRNNALYQSRNHGKHVVHSDDSLCILDYSGVEYCAA